MILAQFPLQIVVFPKEVIPLHIFEPRYRQLINDCQRTRTPFGIPPVVSGVRKEIGTELQLKSIAKKYADGRLDIVAEAKDIYEILTFNEKVPTKLYAEAEVSKRTTEGDIDPVASQKINRLMQELYKIMRIPQKRTPTHFAMHQVVHKIGFTLSEEYALLCLTDCLSQQKRIIRQLEKILPQVREMEEIRKRIELNGDSRFIIPPT